MSQTVSHSQIVANDEIDDGPAVVIQSNINSLHFNIISDGEDG